MAGISAQERRDRQAKVALDKIRDRLPELADQLLEAGLGGKRMVTCPKDKHQFHITIPGDSKLLLSLWERVEGKPIEQKAPSEIQPLVDLFRELRMLREPPHTEIRELPAPSANPHN